MLKTMNDKLFLKIGLFIAYKLTTMLVPMITATYSAKCYDPGSMMLLFCILDCMTESFPLLQVFQCVF